MIYKGPKEFREPVVKCYEYASNSLRNKLQKTFYPSDHMLIEVTLDCLGESLYGYYDEESKQKKLTVGRLADVVDELNLYRILGFDSEIGYNAEFDRRIFDLKEIKTSFLEASRSLRKLCGAEALRTLADKVDEVFTKHKIERKDNPFAYTRKPEFLELYHGLDTRVYSNETGISFSHNFLSEVYMPGSILGGNVPEEITNDREFFNFIDECISRQFGLTIKTEDDWRLYEYSIRKSLTNLMEHGIIHYKLMRHTLPFLETRNYLRSAEGEDEEKFKGSEKEREIAIRQQKIIDLDCDILAEATASIVAPTTNPENICGIYNITGRLERLKLAQEILRERQSLLRKTNRIMKEAWENDRNVIEMLQGVA